MDDEADFDKEFLDYARRALEMAGIETDPKLKAARPIKHSLVHAGSEQPLFYEQARERVPRSNADWEIAAFMAVAVRPAIWDMKWGAIKSFDQFQFLYSRILGRRAEPFLPMLFAVAALNPELMSDFGNELMRTLPEREN